MPLYEHVYLARQDITTQQVSVKCNIFLITGEGRQCSLAIVVHQRSIINLILHHDATSPPTTPGAKDSCTKIKRDGVTFESDLLTPLSQQTLVYKRKG